MNKLGRHGPLDAKLAAAHILANLTIDAQTLDDMTLDAAGNAETLQLVLDLLALSPARTPPAELRPARRDGRLIQSEVAPSDEGVAPASTGGGREGRGQRVCPAEEMARARSGGDGGLGEAELAAALVEIKAAALRWLQAACATERVHARFLALAGLDVVYALAQAPECAACVPIARGVVQLLESLAANALARGVLAAGGCKDVVKLLFKRHEDAQLEVATARTCSSCILQIVVVCR